MTNPYLVDRALPDRSRLKFYFPNTSEGQEYFIVELPFFENIELRETKRARLKKYGLISRSSDLYAYLGAESRKLSLTFSLTLPHMEEEHPEINKDKYISTMGDMSNSAEEKVRFSSPTASPPSNKSWAFTESAKYLQNDNVKSSARQVLGSDWLKYGATLTEYSELKQTYGIGEGESIPEQVAKRGMTQIGTAVTFDPLLMITNPIKAASQAVGAVLGDALQDHQKRLRIIDMIIYWVNVVRSSVINNAKNPTFGPPIVRLQHGLMYQNIPCICTDYSIEWDERMGYDLKTLLPRKINITMNLEEMRTGNFGSFNVNNIIERDNLAGWESVILEDVHTLDPGDFETPL